MVEYSVADIGVVCIRYAVCAEPEPPWNRRLPTRNPPSHAHVLQFRSNRVGVHDGPRTRVPIAEQDHARLWDQGGVEPRQRVGGIVSYFDLDGLHHWAFLLSI